mmetsp:Transcript_13193/g.26900  ORF Transcript_13193/g.26900 Transcript_13193/m.26900 type:complete len:894 (+) Transcript_13193:10-2691(+)
MANSTASSVAADEDFTLDISDVEISQVLRVLNLEVPDYLPVDIPPTSGGPLKRINIPMEELVDGFMSYDSVGKSSGENAFVGIKDILEWCAECWEERQREEDEAKRQRFSIDPADLKRVVSFIDQDGSGSISIKEFQEVFSMVKRAAAQKAMGVEALKVMKQILGWGKKARKTIEDLVRMFDRQGDGLITHRDMRRAFEQMQMVSVTAKIKILDPDNTNAVDTVEFGNTLRKADGEINLQKTQERRKKIWDERFREAEKAALELQKATEESFSEQDLIKVIKFMDPDGSDSIDLEEFIHAFRRARRAKASESVNAEGKELMAELEQFLIDQNFTLIKWFNLMDASFRRAHFDDSDDEESDDDAEWYPNGIKPEKIDPHKAEPTGTITGLELKKGLQHLGCGFDETEIGLIMRFMDPNSDGELTYPEVKDSFRKLHKKTESEVIQEEVGGILMKIENLMNEKGLRMLNVFQELDTDGSGSVTGGELMRGLLKLKAPSGKLKALIKRKTEADAEAERLKQETEERERVIRERIEKAEAAGVSKVLSQLEAFMKEKGLTVTTLCLSIDPDGVGEVDAGELVAAVEKMMQPSGASRAALKRSREKQAARLALAESKRSKARELMEKMKEMEDSGALKCLTMIEAFMRKSCMRIIDMFSKMDATGDGTVDAEELRKGLKKCGLKLKRKDVVLFVRYVDLDGGGEIGMEELEGAIRELRRFNWEKSTFKELISTSGAPLHLRCPSLLFLWRPSSCVDGVYLCTGDDVCAGLMRMRGDGNDDLWGDFEPPKDRSSVVADPMSRGGSRSGSRGGSRPVSKQSNRSRPQSPSTLQFTESLNLDETNPASPMPTTSTFLPSLSASKSPTRDGKGGRMRKEMDAKVKARTWKALHIGVPVDFVP